MKLMLLNIAILLLLCVNCTNTPNDSIKEIPFGDGIEHVKEINISRIASDVEYIALETTPDCLLGRDLYNVEFCGDYLFVRGDYQLFQFSKEGKFIRKIGKEGQVPEEYLKITSAKYDNHKREIYVNDLLAKKIKVYSFDGNFIRDIPVGDGELLLHYDSDNKLFYMYPMLYFNKQNSSELIVYNENGEKIYDFPFIKKENVKYPGFIFTNTIIYTYNNALYCKDPLEANVYQLIGDKKNPAYFLNLGKYEKYSMLDDMIVTGTGDTGFGEINKEADNKISFYDIFEMSDCIYFHYLQNQRRLALYDKINNEVCRVRGRNAKIDGFTDDLQNGYPILPRFYTDNKIVGYVSAAALLEDLTDKNNVKDSVKHILEDLSEDDNPVLQVVTLKMSQK